MTAETKRRPVAFGAGWRNYPVNLPGSTPKPAGRAEKAPVAACAAGGGHHWRIEEAHGGKRLLEGVCRKCGATRADFRAGEDFASFKELGDIVHVAKGGMRLG